MIICMRTTLQLNDQLIVLAKERAAQTRRSLTSVIEDALRIALLKSDATTVGKTRRVVLPASGSGGLLPGVDLDHTATLLDRMEGRA